MPRNTAENAVNPLGSEATSTGTSFVSCCNVVWWRSGSGAAFATGDRRFSPSFYYFWNIVQKTLLLLPSSIIWYQRKPGGEQ